MRKSNEIHNIFCSIQDIKEERTKIHEILRCDVEKNNDNRDKSIKIYLDSIITKKDEIADGKVNGNISK